jgi:hypothetical protein
VNVFHEREQDKIRNGDRGDPSTTYFVCAQGERVFYSDAGELIRIQDTR